MVRQLVWRTYGVNLSVQSLGYLLRAMGMSFQRPKYRATQQDRIAIESWKNETFPNIVREAHEAGAAVMFGDEAAVRSDYHAGGTWSPIGNTPIVDKTGDRFTINMISAVGPDGDFHFSLIDGSCNSAAFIEYCRDLMADMKRPVFLIADGASYHHSAEVQKFVKSTEGRLRIFKLPAYSPELNPDERVWRNLKAHTVAKIGIQSKDHMAFVLRAAADRLYSVPGIVRGFFNEPDLAYISKFM
jgi:transposase